MRDQRRVLCTLGIGRHEELLEIALPSFERYAVRHGYDLVARTEVAGLGGRPPAWGKVLIVREMLERYDVVVWVDADAVIVDPTDDIGASRAAQAVQLVSHRVDGVVVPNFGVFVMRRSARAVWLLERIWHDTRYLHHRWWENAALIAAVGGDGDVGLATRRQRWRARLELGRLDHRWNSVPPCPAPDPAIVHLAGVSHAERVGEMTRLAASAARRAPLLLA